MTRWEGGLPSTAGKLRRALLVIAVIASGLAAGAIGEVASAPSASAVSCAADWSRRLGGTVEGEDSRYVWAFLGIEFFDASGQKIDMNGCPLNDADAYSTHLRINREKLSGHGAVEGEGLTKAWEVVNVPSNADTAWIEAYPMTNDPPETVSRVRYGHTMRRAVKLANTSVNLRFPNRCGEAGGRAGAISGRFVVDGKPVTPDRVWVWTTSPDSPSYIMGWGMAELREGRFRAEPLAGDQTYVMWATYEGKTHKFWNIEVRGCRDSLQDVIIGRDVRDVDAIAGLVDVPIHSYYARPAAWALSKGITTGVGGTDRYKPRETVTRGQMVTFLWRLAGEPATVRTSGFTDVPANAYYSRAVAWARVRGITTGVGGTNRFEPNRPVTRAEVVTLIWRSLSNPPRSTKSGFTDVPRNTYYAAAVTWARNDDITTGVGGTNRFEPARSLTRAEMITLLWRWQDEPEPGRPPRAPTQTCNSFTRLSRAEAFYEMYEEWGDIAGLREDGVLCPMLYGSPL